MEGNWPDMAQQIWVENVRSVTRFDDINKRACVHVLGQCYDSLTNSTSWAPCMSHTATANHNQIVRKIFQKYHQINVKFTEHLNPRHTRGHVSQQCRLVRRGLYSHIVCINFSTVSSVTSFHCYARSAKRVLAIVIPSVRLSVTTRYRFKTSCPVEIDYRPGLADLNQCDLAH